MNTYATSATVEARGEVRVAGVPFEPGTEVEVTITPKAPPAVGLCFDGIVLVHQGVGTGPPVQDVRDERLDCLGQGRSR